jgi:hypothetical protein
MDRRRNLIDRSFARARAETRLVALTLSVCVTPGGGVGECLGKWGCHPNGLMAGFFEDGSALALEGWSCVGYSSSNMIFLAVKRSFAA